MDMPLLAASNPLSDDYRNAQMELYGRIAGRTYALTNEATPFDVETASVTPFPFSTRSCQTAGAHIVLVGEFLRHLNLPPGARIVEFGPGWGNLTLALASLGYEVTAVDIEDRFCQLIKRRAERMGLTVHTVNADFNWAGSVSEPFDAAIFFECFHHSADHLQLLRNLHATIKPGGRVYMGAEPILADFPIPWGLRMDGQSLWSIRKFGWMELGFRDDYFRSALAATGWNGIRHPIADPAIWELSSALPPLHIRAGNPNLGTLTGRRAGDTIVFERADAGFGLFGPYVSLPAGSYRAAFVFDAGVAILGGGELQVCRDRAELVVARRRVEAPELSAAGSLCFTLKTACTDLEVRLLNDAGFTGVLSQLTIEAEHDLQ